MSFSADLERRHIDPAAWDDYLRDGLAAWAADTVEPAAERDLGRLSGWAEMVCERREP